MKNNKIFVRTKYIQIYKVIFISVIKNKINEEKYIEVLQKLSSKGFKTYHVDNIEKLIIYLKNNKLEDAFNISLLIHLRDVNYKTISEIALKIEGIGKIFSVKKNKMEDRINNIRRLLKWKYIVNRSFKKLETSSYIYSGKEKLTKERIDKEYIYYKRKDIIDRLHLLVEKHYDLELLKYMNVKLVSINDIIKYDYKTLEIYYYDCINKIDIALKEWMKVCKLYLEVELNYIDCCNKLNNNKKTKLKLVNYKLNTL